MSRTQIEHRDSSNGRGFVLGLIFPLRNTPAFKTEALLSRFSMLVYLC